jgi:hypothetical protein
MPVPIDLEGGHQAATCDRPLLADLLQPFVIIGKLSQWVLRSTATRHADASKLDDHLPPSSTLYILED